MERKGRGSIASFFLLKVFVYSYLADVIKQNGCRMMFRCERIGSSSIASLFMLNKADWWLLLYVI